MEAITATLIKGGEDVTRITIHRSSLAGKVGVGFLVTVQVHPRIEEFVRSLGTGEMQDIRAHGRYWLAIGNTPLAVYHMHTPLGVHHIGEDFFTIDKPGQPLLNGGSDGRDPDGPSSHRGEVINLSPLRLVGASDGAGVTFGVKGVYTLDALKDLRDMFMDASRQFYITYLKPVNLSVIVSTQEIYPPVYKE